MSSFALDAGKIIHVDKRITLGDLKKMLEKDMGCSHEFFKVSYWLIYTYSRFESSLFDWSRAPKCVKSVQISALRAPRV